jgi:hypothetical protein
MLLEQSAKAGSWPEFRCAVRPDESRHLRLTSADAAANLDLRETLLGCFADRLQQACAGLGSLPIGLGSYLA